MKHPKLSAIDHAVLVGASAITSTWRETVLLVKPDTILRCIGKRFSGFGGGNPTWQVADPRLRGNGRAHPAHRAENRLWGAQRCSTSEIHVAKRTVQRCLKSTGKQRQSG